MTAQARSVLLVVLGLIPLALVGVSGCRAQIDHGAGPGVGIGHSVLRDNTLTLDLRGRHPTRADFGMDSTSSYAGYGSTDDPIRVVIELPRGTLTFDRAQATAATDDAGGATERNAALAPTYFTVTEKYPSASAARAAAIPRARPLGLTTGQVDEALRNASGMFDAQGSPDGWRSARLSFTAGSNPVSYDANYFFDLDVFHNTAVDAIDHAGTLDLDLRTAPTRAALAFRPGYTFAVVLPEPRRALVLDLRTPTGHGRVQLSGDEAVSSTAGTAGGPPSDTAVTTCAAPAAERTRLLALSGLLGWPRDRVAALPERSSTENTTLRLTGSTSAFDSTLKYEPSSGAGLDSCATMVLTYRS